MSTKDLQKYLGQHEQIIDHQRRLIELAEGFSHKFASINSDLKRLTNSYNQHIGRQSEVNISLQNRIESLEDTVKQLTEQNITRDAEIIQLKKMCVYLASKALDPE